MNKAQAQTDIYDPKFTGEVTVEFSPVSERYWNKGDKAMVRLGQIRLGGCWFTFDKRTIVTI